ncbi:MAG: ATP-binding protein [Ottowia sp.]|nr:ATP-binding protein [Ottowia sp.]
MYGANASGKSNVLLAFRALQYLVTHSGNLTEGRKIACYEPFRLSEQGKTSPVKFEIEFVNNDGIRFIYVISFDQTSILEESLDFYPSRQKANLFKRNNSDTWETISFGSQYKGGEKRIAFFNNNSYLSKAGNNASSPEIIRSVYKYFTNSIVHLRSSDELYVSDFSLDAETLNKVSLLLCHVDTGVAGITRNEKPELPEILFPEGIPDSVKKKILERNSDDFVFLHKNENGNTESFKQDLESDGTQRMFGLMPLLIDVFSNGGVLIADELDSSLHPHIAELIIKLFNDSEINTLGAQLIFSTHNINLMTSSNLRRDQIWFTEKSGGATRLYCLADFDKQIVKQDSPYGHWYDAGRFGALPRIDYQAIARILQPNSPALLYSREVGSTSSNGDNFESTSDA